MTRRRWFFAFALGAAVAPSALACFVSIDESRIGADPSYGLDATTSDAPSPADAAPGVSVDAVAAAEAMAPSCDAASPPVIELHGISTNHDIHLTVTSGPMYMVTRNDKMGDPAVNVGSIGPCVGTFHDYGQSGGDMTEKDGGLIGNYEYFYQLTVLLPDAGDDPSYAYPLLIDVQTHFDDDAGTAYDNVTELCAAGADACADAGELGPDQ